MPDSGNDHDSIRSLPEDLKRCVPADASGDVDVWREGDGPAAKSSLIRVRLSKNVPQITESPESSCPAPESTRRLPRLATTRLVRKTPATASQRQDPVVQSVLLLLTLLVMLATARFAVPRIVEEVRYAWHRGQLRAEYETGVDGLKNVSLDTLSDAYQMVTASVGPSVVHIDVQRPRDPIDKKLAAMLPRGGSQVADQGSGVIVDGSGFILTNRHVIADGEAIHVTLSDGRRVPAHVVGMDLLTDLAVLQIEADRLFAIQWGDSDRCRVGSPVWAVGSPFGLDRTVTFGILSGKHRVVSAVSQHGARGQYQDFMQSDVAVNPGNSGGPLVDARGTLIGINTAIVGDTYQGVSFSIPSNVAKQIYQKILETGSVHRGWLGVVLEEVAVSDVRDGEFRVRGARVQMIPEEHSPAAQAGLHPGDIIRAVDDTPISDVGHLMRLIGNAAEGVSVRLKVHRDEQTLDLVVVLGSRPLEIDQ